ncbi:cell division protein [Pelomonas sp. V22]|uniref:cell division protein n=1 Tax=Pelomonas sp. V22 TaxID=2822139 RepID=UPI0024A8BBAA|nr:cell division protein [Pelomonas sp. V22]MDI4633391.1 cell division protein [Pelomonas sp. V22]
MESRNHTRQYLVGYLYLAAMAHLLAGLALPWIADAALFDGYHRSIEQQFWSGSAPPPARPQQLWWIALFGATVQNLAVWMLALVHLGHRHRLRAAWGWLIAGLLLWAPQDMLISLQAKAWPHLWLDGAVLLALLPPLLWLWNKDRPS